MKVFVTGASGYIGSAIVNELIASGHEVLGLARSEAAAKLIEEVGAKVIKGNLEDLDSLRNGALQADGVIHTAYIHDFTQYQKAGETDKTAIEAMGEVLKGTNKPIIVASGIPPKNNGYLTEMDIAPVSPRASESAALALAEADVNASVVRLPRSVHDKQPKGFIPFIVSLAHKNGVSAYVGDGSNRWSAVHRLDAAHLFCLALEKAEKGARYHALGDEAIPFREIAEVIGKGLNLPVKSISKEETVQYFDWMSAFVEWDTPATCRITKEKLNWQPTHIGLIEEIQQHYI
ncbi:SDR family oxidoreductase [Microbacter margulisiae]|uniref:Nucleoside-diphosphate-sugar epimerase n=1 Tax=Microbacter margulisiae TaxID=1350067 RepID=A0A7W5H2C2_9PORP|nr:SDR family oxidoreductase [Microbacter margulisiae]MBB3187474.1 nucleoside-diphosphate-sugar epimerase [Microbacter margulisiae]